MATHLPSIGKGPLREIKPSQFVFREMSDKAAYDHIYGLVHLRETHLQDLSLLTAEYLYTHIAESNGKENEEGKITKLSSVLQFEENLSHLVDKMRVINVHFLNCVSRLKENEYKTSLAHLDLSFNGMNYCTKIQTDLALFDAMPVVHSFLNFALSDNVLLLPDKEVESRYVPDIPLKTWDEIKNIRALLFEESVRSIARFLDSVAPQALQTIAPSDISFQERVYQMIEKETVNVHPPHYLQKLSALTPPRTAYSATTNGLTVSTEEANIPILVSADTKIKPQNSQKGKSNRSLQKSQSSAYLQPLKVLVKASPMTYSMGTLPKSCLPLSGSEMSRLSPKASSSPSHKTIASKPASILRNTITPAIFPKGMHMPSCTPLRLILNGRKDVLFDVDRVSLVQKFKLKCEEAPDATHFNQIRSPTGISNSNQEIDVNANLPISRLNQNDEERFLFNQLQQENLTPIVESAISHQFPGEFAMQVEHGEDKYLSEQALQASVGNTDASRLRVEDIMRLPNARDLMKTLSLARKGAFAQVHHKDATDLTPKGTQLLGTTGDTIADTILIKHHRLALDGQRKGFYQKKSFNETKPVFLPKLESKPKILRSNFRRNSILPASYLSMPNLVTSITRQDSISNNIAKVDHSFESVKEAAVQIQSQTYRLLLEIRGACAFRGARTQTAVALPTKQDSNHLEKLLLIRIVHIDKDDDGLVKVLGDAMELLLTRVELAIVANPTALVFFDLVKASELLTEIVHNLEILKFRGQEELVLMTDIN